MKLRSTPWSLSVGLVLLLAACQQNVPTIKVSPSFSSANTGGPAQSFTAIVAGGTGTVVWTLSPATGSGTISTTSGTVTQYTPPTVTSSSNVVTLTAALQGTSASDYATITLNGTLLSSDRNIKSSFKTVDASQVLTKVAALPMSTWMYNKDTAGVRHLGPMAQDFHAAFGLNGTDDQHIAIVDEGGVALAAIQGLYRQNQRLEQQNRALQGQLAAMDQRLAALEKR
jgi:hypothetical protein